MLFLCLLSNLFCAPCIFQGRRWGKSRRDSDATKQLAEIVAGFASLFPARAVHRLLIRSRSRVSLSSSSLDVVWGGARAGASLAFLAPPAPILQAERSLSLLDLCGVQLSFTARSGIYHHHASLRLFSS